MTQQPIPGPHSHAQRPEASSGQSGTEHTFEEFQGAAGDVEPDRAACDRWLLTAEGESMTHTGPFHEAAELAERAWIAQRGEPEGDLVWLRRRHGVWQLLYQEGDGSLMDTKIKVRPRGDIR